MTQLAVAFAFGLGVVALVTVLAVRPAWLGLRFSWNGQAAEVVRSAGPGAAVPAGTVVTALESAGGSLELGVADLVTEP
ncbi:hypothetical protein, partial [Luteolibacter marinus]|uniref:hypothetical protein n=1 Tax=Luteolibacter marinus TaxID=2776705 RepID=UPI001D014F11